MLRNEWVMKSALSVCLLLGLAWLFSALTFHLVSDTSYFLLACIVSAVIYPFSLGVTRAGIKFWKGLLLLLLILFLAQAFAGGVYFWKMNAVHHDEGEAGAVAIIYFLASLVIAVVFYPLGFWIPRWFNRRQMDSLPAPVADPASQHRQR
jgi:hypothetical protein